LSLYDFPSIRNKIIPVFKQNSKNITEISQMTKDSEKDSFSWRKGKEVPDAMASSASWGHMK